MQTLLLFLTVLLGISMALASKEAVHQNKDKKNDTGARKLEQQRVAPDMTVASYYYPWHGDDFHGQSGYLRKEIGQKPRLGEYDDSDPAVVRQHLRWSRQAGISVWITSWFGPNKKEDRTTKDVILPVIEGTEHKICLFYETNNRLKDKENQAGRTTQRIMKDIQYIARNYFDHPNYYRIQGKPVIFIYLSRTLQKYGIQEETLLLLRTGASRAGFSLFLVGDEAFGNAPEKVQHKAFQYLDAVTNYDVYGHMAKGNKGAPTQKDVRDFYLEQREWKIAAKMFGCSFLPSVSPGYNDRAVRLHKNHPPLSRRLKGQKEGTFFEFSLKHAIQQVDEDADNLLIVNSFNEWHEDTQIEPADGPPSAEPRNFTMGVPYAGYGELYLDILKRFVDGEESADEEDEKEETNSWFREPLDAQEGGQEAPSSDGTLKDDIFVGTEQLILDNIIESQIQNLDIREPKREGENSNIDRPRRPARNRGRKQQRRKNDGDMENGE